MCLFRETLPERRTDIVNKTRYQSYRQELQEDFNARCGYCDDHESWKNSFYEIDHFIPKILLSENEHADYNNLVFSCRYCNNSKSNKWPTNDRVHCNDGKIGFIDPCNGEYDIQFERNLKGEIIPKTELDLRRHSIVWQIEKIDNILNEFRMLNLDKNDQYKDLFIRISCCFQDFVQEVKEENVR